MAGLCFPSRRDEMRGNQCAINSPRFTATSSRGLFHCSPPLARLKHSSCQPVRFHFGLPDGYSPLSLRIISIYFPHPLARLLHLSHPPPSFPSRRRVRTRPGMDLLALFRDLFSPKARRDLWRRVY